MSYLEECFIGKETVLDTQPHAFNDGGPKVICPGTISSVPV